MVEISDTDQQPADGTHTWPMRGHRRKPSRGPELPVLDQLPVSVLSDMRYDKTECTLLIEISQ